MILFALLSSLFVTSAIIFMNFSMGALFANYKENNPIRISSSQGASVTFLATIFYMTFIMLVLYFPVHDYFEYLSVRISFEEVDFLAPIVIIFISSLIMVAASYSVLIKTLRKDY